MHKENIINIEKTNVFKGVCGARLEARRSENALRR